MRGELPDVDIKLPWLGKIAMIAVGIAVIWLPMNELARDICRSRRTERGQIMERERELSCPRSPCCVNPVRS